jgi:programmed cell death protein 4
VAAEYLSEPVATAIAEAAEKLKDPVEVAKAKNDAQELVNEFLDNEDLAEAELRVTELKQPHFHHIIVKQIISTSLDRSNRERELASYFLATLSGSTLQSTEVEKGFEILLSRVEDLYNDVPNILEYLSSFLARAVADECLPPAFLARFNLPEQDLATQVIQQAISHLHKKHASARLAKVWGPGDGRSVPQLKKAVRELVTEYFESSDLEEAKKCVKDLNASYFHHEVIHRIVVLTSDRKDREIELASALIKALLQEQIVSERQARLGFARVQAALNDLKLDAPNASEVFTKIQAAVGLK